MTDFVIEKYETTLNPTLFEEIVYNYANFLKQPLTLGMFVPCDDDGNVLEIPKFYYTEENIKKLKGVEVEIALAKKKEVANYKIAKEKVLFNSFLFDSLCLLTSNCALSIIKNTFRIAKIYEDRLPSQEIKVCTIEDLIPYNLDLAVSF